MKNFHDLLSRSPKTLAARATSSQWLWLEEDLSMHCAASTETLDNFQEHWLWPTLIGTHQAFCSKYSEVSDEWLFWLRIGRPLDPPITSTRVVGRHSIDEPIMSSTRPKNRRDQEALLPRACTRGKQHRPSLVSTTTILWHGQRPELVRRRNIKYHNSVVDNSTPKNRNASD